MDREEMVKEKEKSDEEQIKKRLSSAGVNGKIIKSEEFGYYYFFPDENRHIYFRLENLSIKKLY